MSNYEIYLKKKEKLENYIKAMKNQIGGGLDNIDKTGLYFSAKKKDAESIVFETELYHGYRGDSSSSNDYIEGIEKEIGLTLRSLKQTIISKTVERLEKDIKEATENAREEIEEVYKSLTTNKQQ